MFMEDIATLATMILLLGSVIKGMSLIAGRHRRPARRRVRRSPPRYQPVEERFEEEPEELFFCEESENEPPRPRRRRRRDPEPPEIPLWPEREVELAVGWFEDETERELEVGESTVKRYTVRGNDYAFTIKRMGSAYRAYIDQTPSYGSRDTGASVIHRLYDSNANRYYICFTPDPTTLDGMEAVAEQYAQKTQDYIDFGKRFDE